MHIATPHNIRDFRVVGINYKKSDTGVRGSFAVNTDQYNYLFTLAPGYGISEFFVVSTCNRTEIYGLSQSADKLKALLCNVCTGNEEQFAKLAYSKSGSNAIEHLFEVAAGLDSQILGDYEILGQIKQALKQAKAGGFMGTFTERLTNSAMQSSKAVRTHTQLSSGTVSVAFAAIQFIKERVAFIGNKKIAVIGAGKIGSTTCKNLVHYLKTRNITLCNRTNETAQAVAQELALHYTDYINMPALVAASDIIIVSTGAAQPLIHAAHLAGKGGKLVLDLSVPCNVAPEAADLPGITLINVDKLSRIKDETLDIRRSEIPKAKSIIADHIDEFKTWLSMRKYAPVLKHVKKQLAQIPAHMLPAGVQPPAKDAAIQNVINVMATKMRRAHAPGCHYIEDH